jgi:hypothetical protein
VKEPLGPIGDQLGHGRAPVGIRHRAEHAAGFVHREVAEVVAHVDSGSVDVYDRRLRIDPTAHLGDHDPIDGDPTVGDQVLALTTGSDSRGG